MFETPINKRASFAEASRGLFHLSMPDIANEQKDASAVGGTPAGGQSGGNSAPRQWTHNRKAQHRHFKAKMNLNPKLEAVRKHSSDSGTSVEDSTTNSNSVIANSASGGQIASRPSNCDSGLGTPVSLLDEMAVSATTSSSLAGSSTGHNSSQGSSGAGQLSKWRSSMSGKTTAETFHRNWSMTTFAVLIWPRILKRRVTIFVCFHGKFHYTFLIGCAT